MMKPNPDDNQTEAYILHFPPEVQEKLKVIRSAIQAVTPGATERTDYFRMPGYSYEGYDYDGMFVWFSYKKPYVRLHIRPPVIDQHQKELTNFPTTKSIVSFPADEDIPIALVKNLVKASLQVMKEKAEQ